MAEVSKTYSISLRVRRVNYEDAYVLVPITDEVTKKNEDGTFQLDTDAFFSEAVRISEDPRVEWSIESKETQPHPEQIEAPETRKSFDEHYT